MTDPSRPVETSAIQEHLETYVEQGKINKWAIPQQIMIVDEIPKTSVGKLNKKVIRQQLAD